jgi:hypothetical protein
VSVGVVVSACGRTNVYNASMRAVRDRVVSYGIHDSTPHYCTIHYSNNTIHARTKIKYKALLSVEFFPTNNKNESDYF